MRKPATIDVGEFVAGLEALLREEVLRTNRMAIPERLRHLLRALKTLARPLVQSGAMVLTALSVIVAVGVSPATLDNPDGTEPPLAAPTISENAIEWADRLPRDDLLAIQEADHPDTPPMRIE